jgi:hypothetical protein
MGICLLITASISLCANPLPQGIIQHWTAVRTHAIMMKDVRIEVIKPFHFPNYPVKGSSVPAFSASSLAKVISPWSAFVIVPSGVVLLGKKAHFPPNITQTPLSLPESCPALSYFSKLFC